MNAVIRQYEYNVGRSPSYVDESGLPETPPAAHPVRYIAYYLPQFHEIPENNAWWGAGFTEWTNVTKALPRYVGHYQPRLPGALGFYDLSRPDVVRRQAALAKRAGIYGFCIHNYWFSGKTLLETPLEIIRRNKDIDIPFCLNWANESWSRRWDGSESQILVKQNYAPGEDLEYAEYVAPFVEDERYIKIDGRPLIMLYRPGHLPDARATVERWRDFFVKRGLGDPYVIMPQAFGEHDPRKFGMDGAAGFPPHKVGLKGTNLRFRLNLLDEQFRGDVVAYDEVVGRSLANRADGFRLFPGVCPAWDSSARRPNAGFSMAGSTPEKYGAWLRAATAMAREAPSEDERIVFINAWNEWAEGAYLEPDRHYGFACLAQTRRALDAANSGAQPARAPAGLAGADLASQSFETSWANFLPNLVRAVVNKTFLVLKSPFERT